MRTAIDLNVIVAGFGVSLALGLPVSAQSTTPYEAEPQVASGKFTTATEIKAILPHTKAQWIAVRPYEGQDLLYFTNLLAWRCGLHEIRYGVNGGDKQVLVMEPCYVNEVAPNALKVDQGVLPYVSLPLESVQTIELELLFDDLSEDRASYERAAVQIN